VISPEGNETIFLEEFQFTQDKGELTPLIEVLKKFGIEESELKKQLLIMNNNDFADFCRTATAITPHISIDNKTKTVKEGALWYEETLPPDTLLYVMLLANASRNASSTLSASDVLEKVMSMFTGEGKPYLQIGGNETLGMGWCKVKDAGEKI